MIKTCLLILLITLLPQGERQSERNVMINNHIKARGITHQPTIDAMRKVQRHKLVPPNQQANAYRDSPLPIGYGQTISQPYIVAYMTEAINPAPGQRVLEIGTGSGYQAAVLAEIVDQVYTIEIVPELGQRAIRDLDALGYDNIHVKIDDGYHGWEEHAPYDAIIVTAAAEYIPPPLIAQLKDGGKMIIPVGTPFMTQQLVLVEKVDRKVRSRNVMPVRFVPFTRSED